MCTCMTHPTCPESKFFLNGTLKIIILNWCVNMKHCLCVCACARMPVCVHVKNIATVFRVMSAVMWLEVYSLFTGPSDLYLSSPRPFALCAAYISQNSWGQSVQGKDPLHLFYGPISIIKGPFTYLHCLQFCLFVCLFDSHHNSLKYSHIFVRLAGSFWWQKHRWRSFKLH